MLTNSCLYNYYMLRQRITASQLLSHIRQVFRLSELFSIYTHKLAQKWK